MDHLPVAPMAAGEARPTDRDLVKAMKLSRTVDYAVRATLELARQSESAPVPCSQLAAAGGMPERFLLQILRNLVTHGILRSTRGVEGGYTLLRPVEEISLLEIIEAIEGPMEQAPEIADDDDEAYQRLADAIREVTHTARAQLGAIKLGQLLKPPDDSDEPTEAAQ